ncbi:phenolic acid decarboxylase [Nocardia altamirensis]|uniref:phenolic acid decarboxylase n=1 Tax=Nocardia altamirensis TaxID=472158 RepID=UPI0008403543|nr:phenolic acid decarboxylase [Nocardia altamirensis]
MVTSQFATQLPQDNQDLSGLLGQHLIYTYSNGWRYELYIKNSNHVEYRVHASVKDVNPLAGRWVKDQKAVIARLGNGMYSIAWNEPTGTCVNLVMDTEQRWVHFTGFLAKWVSDHPELTVVFQNEHLAEIQALRDAGPIAPQVQADLFGTISFAEYSGTDNEQVIASPPGDVPDGFLDRTN